MAWCILLVLGANPAGAQPRPAAVADTVRGAPRVVNLATSPDQLPQLELRELWRVGGVDAPPEAQFAGPYMATALDDAGRAWVLDQTSERLALFDASGKFLATVAGPGRGPGELAFPTGLSVGPDGKVWVQGATDGYYKVFGSDGKLVRTLRQTPHPINRIITRFAVGSDGILNHAGGYPTITFFRADTLATPLDSFRLAVPAIGAGGILRPGSAAYAVRSLRPFLRWTMSADGSSIWVARTDSLALTRLSVRGDTMLRVEARHRTAEFTAKQRRDIRRAEHEMRNPGAFAPVLIQAIHGLDGGRVLVQVGSDGDTPGGELDLYQADGVLKGVVHAPIPISLRSELSSRGDTILFVGVGEYDVPVLVKAVISMPRDPR